MLKNYFLVAIRSILRNRTIAFINVFGLAVSMSICLLLILIVADQYAYDNFHTKKDSIYRINTDRTELNQYKWSTATAAYPLIDEVRQLSGVDKATVIKRKFEGVAKWNDQEIPFYGYYTDNNFLSIFDYPLAKGNIANSLKLPNALIVTQDLAHKLFGDDDPINKVVMVEDMAEFIITGVFDQFPGKTHLDFQALASVDILRQLEMQNPSFYSGYGDWNNIYDSYIYFTAKEGTDLNNIKSRLDNIVENNYQAESKFEYEFVLQPLAGITPGPLLSNNAGFGLPDFMIYIMLGIALIVLCSACFNYANLTTARAINRAKEMGVRKVVGAGKRHIIAQFMIESILVALVSFLFADLFVQFILPRINNYFLALGAPIRFDETPGLYGWFLLFVLLAGLLAGLVPSLYFAATNPLTALKKSIQLEQLGKRFGVLRIDMRKVLVVVQFSFSVFFIITMITLYQQMNYVLKTDHGFTSEHIINVQLQGVDYNKLNYKFDQLSGVQTVAATSHLPALGTNNTVALSTEVMEEPIHASYFAVDGEYVKSMGLEIMAGTDFPTERTGSEEYILINEEAVVALGWKSNQEAVGQVISVSDQPLVIIGVLKNFHYERLDEEIGPMALRYLPEYVNSAIIKVSGDNPRDIVAELENIWKEVTNRPFKYSLYEDDLRQSYAHFEALLLITSYVSIIVISLACLGLLGMVIYHIQNRTKEIGVRKTLGAAAKDILFTVSKGFVILLGVSFLIGGPIAYFVNNAWLELNAYRVDFGITTVLIGFGLLLAIITLTIGSQLYKALQINPVDSLKTE